MASTRTSCASERFHAGRWHYPLAELMSELASTRRRSSARAYLAFVGRLPAPVPCRVAPQNGLIAGCDQRWSRTRVRVRTFHRVAVPVARVVLCALVSLSLGCVVGYHHKSFVPRAACWRCGRIHLNTMKERRSFRRQSAAFRGGWSYDPPPIRPCQLTVEQMADGAWGGEGVPIAFQEIQTLHSRRVRKRWDRYVHRWKASCTISNLMPQKKTAVPHRH